MPNEAIAVVALTSSGLVALPRYTGHHVWFEVEFVGGCRQWFRAAELGDLANVKRITAMTYRT